MFELYRDNFTIIFFTFYDNMLCMGRIIGIDYGTKRIGLAIADTITRIAMPWCILDAANDPVRDAAAVVRKLADAGENPERFVVGLPTNMADATEGPQAKISRTFGEALNQQSGVPVEFQDERLSSFAAEALFRLDQRSQRNKRPAKKIKPKKPLDAVAAAVILGSYLKQERGI